MINQLEIRLLGAFELLAGGRPVELGGAKRHALLALLALRGGRLADVETLIDALSGEDLPSAPGNALQHHVARLRAALRQVRKGHVTLRGAVKWGYQREDAERAIEHLKGVRGVSNEITVKPLPEADATDVERRVEGAIERLADLDARSISVTTTDGTVRLRGSVHSLAEFRLAQRAAESAPGVTKVANDLVVTP